MAKSDTQKMLQSVPLFEGLAKTNLRHLTREFEEELYSPGQTIVAQGEGGGRFFIILEGRAKVEANKRSRAKLGPGDFFGEMSVIDRAPRSASIIAETHVKALAITSWNFLGVLEENWPIARKILIALSQRVRDLETSVIH